MFCFPSESCQGNIVSFDLQDKHTVSSDTH